MGPLLIKPVGMMLFYTGADTSFPANKEYWESMLAEPVFDARRQLQSIALYPLTLGFGQNRPDRGFPFPADPEEAKSIMERVAKLSAAMGTTVTVQNGVGIVKVGKGE